MINSLLIEDFKGIKSLKFDSLQRINLIAGANDVGKTSVLEALCFLYASDSARLQAFPTIFRSGKGDGQPLSPKDQFVHFWGWLVRQGAKEARISADTAEFGNVDLTYGSEVKNPWVGNPGLKGKVVTSQGNLGCQFHISTNGDVSWKGSTTVVLPRLAMLSTCPSSPISDSVLFNAAILGGAEERIEKVLRIVEPRLKKLRFLLSPGTSAALVHADVGLGQLVPSTLMGQGFNRVLNICCQILAAEAKIILVDEIENGIHHEALPRVWHGLKELCRDARVQMFASTHSLECISAAHEAYSSDEQYDFALHRLQRVKGSVEVVTHTREMLEVALNAPIEVR